MFLTSLFLLKCVIQVDYNVATEKMNVDNGDDDKKDVCESTLDMRVQQLLKLICDVRAMEATVLEMEYDTTKAPLGLNDFVHNRLSFRKTNNDSDKGWLFGTESNRRVHCK